MPVYTIDRFEDPDWAVLEDDQARTFRIPRQWMPVDAREGDVLDASDESVASTVQSVRLAIDPLRRDQRLTDAERLRSRLPRGPKGDLSL
jgi:hypothetical protein